LDKEKERRGEMEENQWKIRKRKREKIRKG
jgi:hypothetical protein